MLKYGLNKDTYGPKRFGGKIVLLLKQRRLVGEALSYETKNLQRSNSQFRYTFIHLYIYVCVSKYIYIYIFVCVSKYIYIFVCVCVCVCLYMYIYIYPMAQCSSEDFFTKIWSTAALSWFNMERILSIFFVLLAVATVYGQFNPPVDVVQLCRKVANRMGSHYIRHPRNCTLFYNCDGDLSFPVLLSCQYPLVFSQSQQVCVYGNGLYDDCKKEVFLGGFGEYLSKLFDL